MTAPAFVGAYHPSYLIRGNAHLQGLFTFALGRAVKVAEGSWKPKWNDRGLTRPAVWSKGVKKWSVLKVKSELAKLNGKRVTFDIETDGISPYGREFLLPEALEEAIERDKEDKATPPAQVRCVGLFDGRRGVIVPFLWRVPNKEGVEEWQPYWSPNDRALVLSLLSEFFSKCSKLGTQNGQFDRSILRRDGIRFGDEEDDKMAGRRHCDSLLTHHTLASYLPHDLGVLSALYTEAPYYKGTLTGESWSSTNDYELWLYCARDTKTTWLALFQEMQREIELQPYDAARVNEQSHWQERRCEQWTRNGFLIDPVALRFFRRDYARKRDKALAMLREMIPEKARFGLTMLMWGHEESAEKDGEVPVEVVGPVIDTADTFNPGSLPQLRFVLAALGVPLRDQTETGEIATGEEMLLAARKELVEQRAAIEDVRIRFLDTLLAWRGAAKIYGTYLSPLVGTDGRLHPGFRLGPPTGRLCIAGDTWVRTQRGNVFIRDVRVGDLVWTHRRRWRAVTAVHEQGVKEVFILRLSSGRILQATGDHRFLGEDGRWVTVKELRERFKAMGSSGSESNGRGGVVPAPRLADAGRDLQAVGCELPERSGCASTGTFEGRPRDAENPSLFGFETRPSKPDARVDRETPSSVEGGLRGRARVPHTALERSQVLRSQSRDDEGVEIEATSKEFLRPSHRWEPEEQRDRQSCSRDEQGARPDSREATPRYEGIDVEEITLGGCCPTFDLTVDEDESFEAEGVYSHNSSNSPNIQNQPGEIRGIYIADPGHVLVSYDWDALELRLAAILSGDPVLLKAFADFDAGVGPKVHVVNMCNIFGLKMEPQKFGGSYVKAGEHLADKYPGMYRAAKVFAYALAYGATEGTVFEGVRGELPDLDEKSFVVVFERFKKVYAKLMEYQASLVTQGTEQGFVATAILGRRSFYFERARWGGTSPEASEMQNFPYQGTAADVVGLANRRVEDRVMVPWQSKLKRGEKLMQLAQVHDELLFLVPKRLVKAFVPQVKELCELNSFAKEPSIRLPVASKVSHRWKAVKAKCTCGEKVEIDEGFEAKCKCGSTVSIRGDE